SARRPSLDAQDGLERLENRARPPCADRDGHGRLGTAVAQVRFLSRLRGCRAGTVHRIQNLFPSRHEKGRCAVDASRAAAAAPAPDVHPVPVAVRRLQRMLMAMLVAAPATVAVAQTPRTITLRIDNDAFDFWMLPWNRPDEEYSSGVHITYDGGDAPWWSRRMLRQLAPCTTSSRECRMSRAEIGQDLYTPATSITNPVPAVGSRPNAGWLYLSQTAQSLRTERSDELTLTLGVTGGPSLGKFTQTLAHSVAPTFN